MIWLPALLKRGYEVHAVLSGDVHRERAGAQLAGAEVHVCDLLDPPSIERLLAVQLLSAHEECRRTGDAVRLGVLDMPRGVGEG